MSDKEKLELSIERLKKNESVIYILTYDTKTNPRASVKYIYDLAKTLTDDGKKVKLIVEDKTYSGVSSWLGDKYNDIEIVYIKDENLAINVDDTLIVPEFYSNALEQLKDIRCTKIMLIQQKEYIFETLPIGVKWSNFGFNRVITTTENTKKYIMEYFPESLVYVIPPIIDDVFKPYDKPLKPYVAISCRDRAINKKIISEFYLKNPFLRWVTFRDMNQMTYEEFAEALRECMVSVWIDDESTFGTFPLESIKSGVPVIGKVPKNEPDWLKDNGLWTYDENKIVELLGKYILANINGIDIDDDLKRNMSETLIPYDEDITKNNIKTIFENLKNKTIEVLEKTLDKFNTKEK
jgi:hypothetical protein